MGKLPDSKYAKKYSEKGFLDWCRKFAKKAGYETMVKLFELYYVLTSGKPPQKPPLSSSLHWVIPPVR